MAHPHKDPAFAIHLKRCPCKGRGIASEAFSDGPKKYRLKVKCLHCSRAIETPVCTSMTRARKTAEVMWNSVEDATATLS